MKKFLVTLATLFSSHAFSVGNIQALQGRFSVNASKCTSFQKYTPSRAFISAQSADSLLIEFLGSEDRSLVVYLEDGEDMGRNGRETFQASWTSQEAVMSSRKFVNDKGVMVSEVVKLESTSAGVTVQQFVDGKQTLSCELIRGK